MTVDLQNPFASNTALTTSFKRVLHRIRHTVTSTNGFLIVFRFDFSLPSTHTYLSRSIDPLSIVPFALLRILSGFSHRLIFRLKLVVDLRSWSDSMERVRRDAHAGSWYTGNGEFSIRCTREKSIYDSTFSQSCIILMCVCVVSDSI